MKAEKGKEAGSQREAMMKATQSQGGKDWPRGPQSSLAIFLIAMD